MTIAKKSLADEMMSVLGEYLTNTQFKSFAHAAMEDGGFTFEGISADGTEKIMVRKIMIDTPISAVNKLQDPNWTQRKYDHTRAEVKKLALKGLTNLQMARRLRVSVSTIDRHLKALRMEVATEATPETPSDDMTTNLLMDAINVRRRNVANMFKQNNKPAEISNALGVSLSTVYSDIRLIKSEQQE